jgi:hypothetical protein
MFFEHAALEITCLEDVPESMHDAVRRTRYEHGVYEFPKKPRKKRMKRVEPYFGLYDKRLHTHGPGGEKHQTAKAPF